MKATKNGKSPIDVARNEETKQFLIEQCDNIHKPLTKITEDRDEDEDEEAAENYDFYELFLIL